MGLRKTMRKLDPKMPTDVERKEHEFTHLPYRSWCRHCVRGRGKEEACRRGAGSEVRMPEVHLDFMFMGEEHGGKTLAILVAKERTTRATLATVAPRKSSGEWLSRRLMAWLREIGCEYIDITV